MRYGPWVCLATLIGLAGTAAAAPTPPALPEAPGWPLFLDVNYANNAQARAAWKPMDETAPVSVVPAGPRKALRLPCNLAGNQMERASWDASIQLDAAASRGIQFRFFCANPDPVSGFSIYFHSGKGWYATPFSPKSPQAWNTILIDKTSTKVEDAPAGWGAIDAIRISAWRGQDEDTECYVADLGLWGGGAPVAILRKESASPKGGREGKAAAEYAQTPADVLDSLGVPYAVLSDVDLSAAHLKGVKLLVLPNCPDLDDATATALSEFVESGGKIVSFYTLPGKLLPVLGFKEGQYIKQESVGQFDSIRPAGAELPGLPPVVKQKSWNISELQPIEGRSRVAAWWFNSAGQSTGHAAILVSDNGAHMTHVLLPDDRANKALLLLAMIGRFVPECWKEAGQSSLDRVGAFGPYKNFAQARQAIQSAAVGEARAALADLNKANASYDKAAKLLESGKCPEAIAAAVEANRELVLAYCAVQKPAPGEHRGIWCHSAFGLEGMTWDEAIKNLADNGFTAILPNMLWGGTAYYESRVLPVAPTVREKGDQIKECLAACKKYGVQCHVWKVNWNMDGRAPKEFAERVKKEKRTQVLFDGEAKDEWLCPSNPANQELEIKAMVEVATQYDVDGIHFDYIRYPGAESCFCAGCRERFEKAIGAKVKNWPGDVRNDPELKPKWLDFRRDQITRVVAAVSEQARKKRPDIKISAAVFGQWSTTRDSIGQDWKLWCEKGYLDFVCPMDYTEHNSAFENLVKNQVAWAGKTPCYPGIGLSVWPDPADIVKLIDQIAIARRLGTGGFTIFSYNPTSARDVIPLCGMGVTRKPG